jgi:hypothetical protein
MLKSKSLESMLPSWKRGDTVTFTISQSEGQKEITGIVNAVRDLYVIDSKTTIDACEIVQSALEPFTRNVWEYSGKNWSELFYVYKKTTD